LNGKQNGNGNFNFQNGDKYSGNFKDGLLSGQGKMTNSNGETYEDEFKYEQEYVIKEDQSRFLGKILNLYKIYIIDFIIFIAFIIYFKFFI
jgi:hypothetical protein